MLRAGEVRRRRGPLLETFASFLRPGHDPGHSPELQRSPPSNPRRPLPWGCGREGRVQPKGLLREAHVGPRDAFYSPVGVDRFLPSPSSWGGGHFKKAFRRAGSGPFCSLALRLPASPSKGNRLSRPSTSVRRGEMTSPPGTISVGGGCSLWQAYFRVSPTGRGEASDSTCNGGGRGRESPSLSFEEMCSSKAAFLRRRKMTPVSISPSWFMDLPPP